MAQTLWPYVFLKHIYLRMSVLWYRWVVLAWNLPRCWSSKFRVLQRERENTSVAYRSEKCPILKHVSDWHGVPCCFEKCAFLKHFKLAPCKRCHIEGRWQYVFFNLYIWSSPTFVTEKQINKQMQPGRTFGLFSLIFMLLYHAFIMRLRSRWSLHDANLKRVSEIHIFQNGTPCPSDMFQNGTQHKHVCNQTSSFCWIVDFAYTCTTAQMMTWMWLACNPYWCLLICFPKLGELHP